MVIALAPADLAELLLVGPVDVIDVRDHDEWATGHLAAARHVPLAQFRDNPEAFLERGVTTVFVCAKGVRSMQAAKLAERFGYERLFNLDGGTKEWARIGMPIVLDARAAA